MHPPDRALPLARAIERRAGLLFEGLCEADAVGLNLGRKQLLREVHGIADGVSRLVRLLERRRRGGRRP